MKIINSGSGATERAALLAAKDTNNETGGFYLSGQLDGDSVLGPHFGLEKIPNQLGVPVRIRCTDAADLVIWFGRLKRQQNKLIETAKAHQKYAVTLSSDLPEPACIAALTALFDLYHPKVIYLSGERSVDAPEKIRRIFTNALLQAKETRESGQPLERAQPPGSDSHPPRDGHRAGPESIRRPPSGDAAEVQADTALR